MMRDGGDIYLHTGAIPAGRLINKAVVAHQRLLSSSLTRRSQGKDGRQ